MATGQAPWADYKNPMSVLYHLANLNTMPPIPQNLSAELKDFLKCCLNLESKERPNVYELLRHPFITGDIMVDRNINNNFSDDINFNYNNYNGKNLNAANDLNIFNSKGYGLSGLAANKEIELIENSQMRNEFLSKFNSRESEGYSKNLNSEFAMK